MMDYSMSLEEREKFILNYDVNKKNMIVIKYADGKTKEIPYDSNTEQMILDIMNKQVENSENFEKKARAYKKSCIIWLYSFLSGVVLFSGLSFYGRTGFELFVYPFLSASCLLSSCFISLDLAKVNSIIKDLERNIWFQKNKNKINENIIVNDNLANVSNKTNNIINTSSDKKEIFNINSFNDVPFRDLEQIVENIDYKEEDISKRRTKVRIRK